MKKLFLLLLIFSFLYCIPVLADDDKNITKLSNPIKSDLDNPSVLIGVVIQAVLGLVGGIALVMMVYGGFQWLTAAGNEEKIKNGTQTMLWAAIGLVLVFSSYLLVETVLSFLIKV